MTQYRSLTGGYFADGTDRTLPVSIRFNNPGAVNSAKWETTYPGYVGEQETTPGNRSTLFETPEHGVAVWWDLLRRYRAAGATTVEQIITRYGGGQDYSRYVDFVIDRTGLKPTTEIKLDDDLTLLAFAKAMFRYEAGQITPLSDNQILYGFAFAREYAKTGKPDVRPQLPGTAEPKPVAAPGFWQQLFSWSFPPKKPVEEKPAAKIPLPGELPAWLQTMREITGTLETPGDSDNPVIMAWCDVISTQYPEMKSYCANYKHDSIPWCGLTIAYVMAKNGIRPRFGPTDVTRFLWAESWIGFGNKIDKPRPGAIMVFTRAGGGHVSLYEGEDERGYIIRGGNQSDSVNVTHMSRDKLSAIVWPV